MWVVLAIHRPTSAARPLDFLKFQRLFQDRLLVGDPEVLALIKNGTMMVTPEQMHQLMDQWEKKALAAGSSRPKSMENSWGLQGLLGAMRGKKPCLGRGGLRQIEPDASTRRRPDCRPGRPKHGRGSLRWPSSRLGNGRPQRWLHRHQSQRASRQALLPDRRRELPATVVKTKSEHDLALLKVDAHDLVPITWADGNPPVPGSWLITPAPEKDVLGLGVVSIPARPIPDAPKILLRNRAIVGVILDQAAKDARIHEVTPNLPAAKAGLKSGDVILTINGERTPTAKDVNQVMGKYQPSDKVTIEITRDGKPMKLKVDWCLPIRWRRR